MTEIKRMSDKKKYSCVQNGIELAYEYIPSFVQRNLGGDAVDKLRNTWQEGLRRIPEDTPVEEKYERAYSNWIWIARNTYSFIRERLGESGVEQYERAEIEELKRKYSGKTMYALDAIAMVSRDFASMLITKQVLYTLQWLTPIYISELNQNKCVVQVPRCKVLDFPNTEDLCHIGCEHTYSIWMAEQFHKSVKTERQSKGCTKIITPLSI
jgi:hypothetical protein